MTSDHGSIAGWAPASSGASCEPAEDATADARLLPVNPFDSTLDSAHTSGRPGQPGKNPGEDGGLVGRHAGRSPGSPFARPRLLELCPCEGGATSAYVDAGWHVTAVDIDAAALKHNPADVKVEGDALAYIAEHGHEYDAIHASFPCQRWSANGANTAKNKWPDYITPGRELLSATGRPWVMENVPKAPLRRDLILCGAMFGLTAVDTDGTLLHLDRHRVFESNVPLHLPAGIQPVSPHRCGPRPGVQWAGVYGGARKDKIEARTIRKGGYVPPDAAVQSALLGGVDWMTGKGRRECIPPVYAAWVSQFLMAAVAREVAA